MESNGQQAQPNGANGRAAPEQSMISYYIMRRELLVTELRYVEAVLIENGAIKRALVAPPRVR